ncbi:DUF6984 family protein [Teredinibacter purpureus]|uniref:DUF6984 family protein n=1 Tax=Teredinibacter purpureus TaxID=2731756 RepID=UPI000695D815|nr:hypothetical protein [Teredinibacter purpureus]
MRATTAKEKKIICSIFEKSGLIEPLSEMLVEPMQDGGMGSLKLGSNHESRSFGKCAAEIESEDSDGVPVIFSLYLDKSGAPYELDVFKADFSTTKVLNDHS